MRKHFTVFIFLTLGVLVFFICHTLLNKTIYAQQEIIFHPIDISQSMNYGITADRHKTFPYGNVVIGSVDFHISGASQNMFLSQCADWDNPNRPQVATFSAEISNPKTVHILINGNNTYNGNYNGPNLTPDFSGKKIGEILLTFTDGSIFIQDIIPAYNFRDWNTTHIAAIDTIDPSSNTRDVTPPGAEVSRYPWGGPVVVDMMEIGLPNNYRNKVLAQISVLDKTQEYFNDYNPGIAIYGITVSSQEYTDPGQSPVLILPGHGGCWSTAGLMYGDTNAQWHLTPFVKLYDNLQTTLENNGYQTEIYCYDWRQPIDQLADELKQYLDNNYPGEQIKLVGHSMGGLLARAYLQKYSQDNKIEKLVSVAGPQQGTLRAYYGWEGGRDDDSWSWIGLAFQLYLHANKNRFQSDVAAVHNLAPSTLDMFPVFEFLKDQPTDDIIPYQSLNIQNQWLAELNDNLDQTTKDLITTVVGIEDKPDDDTVEYFLVEPPNWLDKLLGRWQDGKPVGRQYTVEGDLAVLAKSAAIPGAISPTVTGNHREVIENQAGIETILEQLEITDATISAETISPNRNPSLVFWLRSPASLQVTTPAGETHIDNSQGLLVIPQAEAGNYQIQLTEKDGGGEYHLTLGQLSQSGDVWHELNGWFGLGEAHSAEIYFNPLSPQADPFIDSNGQWYLSQAQRQLSLIQANWSGLTGFYLEIALDLVNQAAAANQVQNYPLVLDKIDWANIYLFKALKANDYSQTELNTNLKDIIKLLLKAYDINFGLSGQNFSSDKQARDQQAADTIHQQVQNQLETLADQGENQQLGHLFLWQDQLLNEPSLTSGYDRFSRWLGNQIQTLID